MGRNYVITRTLLLAATVQFALSGCAHRPDRGHPSAKTAVDEAKKFTLRGIVKGKKKDGSMIMIQHETIPGFMMSMTMPFFVKDPQEVMTLAEGDGIECDYYVNGNESHISKVKRIDPSTVHVAN